MKVLNTFSALVFAGLSFVSVSALAQQQIPVSCTWSWAGFVSQGYYSITTYHCKNEQTLVSTKVVKTGLYQIPECRLTTEPGFFFTGTCQNPSFYKLAN